MTSRSICTLTVEQCKFFLKSYVPPVALEHWKCTDVEDVVHFHWKFLRARAGQTKRLNDSMLKKSIMEWAGVDALTAAKVASSLCMAFQYCADKRRKITTGKKAKFILSGDIRMVIEAMNQYDSEVESPAKDLGPAQEPPSDEKQTLALAKQEIDDVFWLGCLWHILWIRWGWGF